MSLEQVFSAVGITEIEVKETEIPDVRGLTGIEGNGSSKPDGGFDQLSEYLVINFANSFIRVGKGRIDFDRCLVTRQRLFKSVEAM